MKQLSESLNKTKDSLSTVNMLHRSHVGADMRPQGEELCVPRAVPLNAIRHYYGLSDIHSSTPTGGETNDH